MIKAALSLAGRILRDTPLARSKLLNEVQAAIALRLHGSNDGTVGPFRVRFVPSDRIIAKKIVLYGEYDRAQTDLLCSFVEPGDDVLDIGANIGIYSLYLSRAVGPEGRVLAFEPDPANLAILEHNLEANGCRNVRVVPCCLGEKEGEVKLFKVAGNAGGSSLWHRGQDAGYTIVPMRVGDDVVSEFGFRPTVAKIDVEGAEPMVLAGLRTHKPRVILLEYASGLMKGLGSDPHAFLESLVADGYRLAAVDRHSAMAREGSVEEVEALMDHAPKGVVYGDILAVHQSCRRAASTMRATRSY